MRDFTLDTRRHLAQRGVTVLRATTIPSDGDLPFSTGARGYQVDDNGTGRVMTFAQVLERASA